MAVGDLLYIFAFIILPTAVLVSCVWALILLRNGVLLPGRPAARHDISQSADNRDEMAVRAPDPVEETNEHEALDPVPVVSAPVASLPVAPPRAAADPVDPALATNAPPTGEPWGETPSTGKAPLTTPGVEAPPPAERTQELTVAPADAPAVDGEDGDQSVARETQSAERAPAAAADDPGARSPAPERDTAAPATANAASVLIVPLDEPSRAPATVSPPATSGTTSAPQRAAPLVAGDDAAPPDQTSAPPSGSRGLGSWDAPARPADEQSARARAGQRRNARRFGG